MIEACRGLSWGTCGTGLDVSEKSNFTMYLLLKGSNQCYLKRSTCRLA
jgi:hypothetical protein